ncbi:MAG: CBS domain-containing protein [Bacteroidales bacterium]|nr:CBS domain-containing protein [Bacteroidales bacterium]
MIAKQIINDTIPTMGISDSAGRALHYMEFFRVSHLPVVNGKKYIGLLSDEAVFNLKKDELSIEQCQIEKANTFVYETQHVYDVLELMHRFKWSMVVVVNSKKQFLGAIGMNHLLSALAKITSIDQSGSIIVLKLGIRDYSLGQVAQIIEGQDVKILSTYVQNCTDQIHLKLTLKLNTTQIDGVRQALERFNYKIEAIFAEHQTMDELYKDRLDAFLHFLNI